MHAAVTFCTNGVETGKICPSLHTFPSKHRKIFEEIFKSLEDPRLERVKQRLEMDAEEREELMGIPRGAPY